MPKPILATTRNTCGMMYNIPITKRYEQNTEGYAKRIWKKKIFVHSRVYYH